MTTAGAWLRRVLGGAPALRPPGALPEPAFAARCLRCGRCAEVCTFHAIAPAGISSGGHSPSARALPSPPLAPGQPHPAAPALASFARVLGAGTPEIVPRRSPCWLCLRCPPICPTGALGPVGAIREVRMGRAVVIAERCYAHQGVMCRTCLDACPLQGEAIAQDAELRPVVSDRCVGCGLCEHRCPAPDPAIVVDARRSP